MERLKWGSEAFRGWLHLRVPAFVPAHVAGLWRREEARQNLKQVEVSPLLCQMAPQEMALTGLLEKMLRSGWASPSTQGTFWLFSLDPSLQPQRWPSSSMFTSTGGRQAGPKPKSLLPSTLRPPLMSMHCSWQPTGHALPLARGAPACLPPCPASSWGGAQPSWRKSSAMRGAAEVASPADLSG